MTEELDYLILDFEDRVMYVNKRLDELEAKVNMLDNVIAYLFKELDGEDKE